MKKRILIFIPAYNCAAQITRVLASLNEQIQNQFTDVLIVDNGSKDQTLIAAKDCLKKIDLLNYTFVQNQENYNLGGSHKVAFDYAIKHRFDYCIVLHGDDQATISDIQPYLPLLESNDCLLGARFMKQSRLDGYSALRTFGNLVFNSLFSLMTGRVISDLGSGLNAYRISYLKGCPYHNFPNDLNFNHYMLLHACRSKSKIIFFPISWREFDQTSNARLFRMSKQILKTIFRYVTNPNYFIATSKASRSYPFNLIAQRLNP